MMTPLESARGWLAAIWFGGGAVFILILIGQSLGGMFGEEMNKVWAWAIPNILPTLSLMLSVFAAYALMSQADVDQMKVRTTFYRIALGVSVFYLVVLVMVVVMAPFTAASGKIGKLPIDIMHQSNFFLGPIQGLTAAVLAALFFSKSNNAGVAVQKKPPRVAPL
jgi:hypothetical protein